MYNRTSEIDRPMCISDNCQDIPLCADITDDTKHGLHETPHQFGTAHTYNERLDKLLSNYSLFDLAKYPFEQISLETKTPEQIKSRPYHVPYLEEKEAKKKRAP